MSTFINGKIGEFHQHVDTDGHILNVSDGGILYADGAYHWYGQALGDLPFKPHGEGGQVTHKGVNMYRSQDLSTWTYEGVVLKCEAQQNSPLRAPMRFERPKILYNKKTGKYVLWCHYVGYPGDHSFSDVGGEALVAMSDHVNGEYRLVSISRPIDRAGVVRDCTVYQDASGSAYFIYDRHIGGGFNKVLAPFERCLHIVKLSDDYLSFTDEYARIDAADAREAPCIVKHDGYYYMITSGLTGWNYNPAKYFRSRDLMHGWEDMGDPCVGDEEKTTFRTQGTFIFTTREGRDILMSERHNTENFLRCSYIWFPIEYRKDHTLSLSYHEQFSL